MYKRTLFIIKYIYICADCLMERLVVAIQITIVFRHVLKRRTGAMEILTALISQMNIRVVSKAVLLLRCFFFSLGLEFNTTFNNISIISWLLVFFGGETEISWMNIHLVSKVVLLLILFFFIRVMVRV